MPSIRMKRERPSVSKKGTGAEVVMFLLEQMVDLYSGDGRLSSVSLQSLDGRLRVEHELDQDGLVRFHFMAEIADLHYKLWFIPRRVVRYHYTVSANQS